MDVKRPTSWLYATIATLSIGAHSSAFALDSGTLEFGVGDHVKILAVAAQWRWQQQWWKSNGTHLSGYWDLSLAQWRGTSFQNIPGNTQNITSIGITPVFRFQRDSLRGPYAEAGIGIHYLSEHYDNADRQLSTNFQFGDLLGIGYVFPNNVDIGFKIQHFSNGGLKEPNSGVNFALVRVRYSF
jgi:lipid A 3-O-deacylase